MNGQQLPWDSSQLLMQVHFFESHLRACSSSYWAYMMGQNVL
jgi:hypothetical protein